MATVMRKEDELSKRPRSPQHKLHWRAEQALNRPVCRSARSTYPG